jgi:uncharacterized protein YjeT (DUF2065 family)
MHLDQVLAGVAVVLAVEGLLYAVAPGFMRNAVAAVANLPDARLRAGGLVAAALGIGFAWLMTG